MRALTDSKQLSDLYYRPEDINEARPAKPRVKKEVYERELNRLHHELVKWQYWLKATGQRVVIVVEGRDAAGKGGTIRRIVEPLDPHAATVVALPKPTEREMTQWYFQRYVPHLPAAGEIVVFDRSWYNRAGVERVMGFATQEQVQEFFESCPDFERMLVRSGIHVVKYWFSVNPYEQDRRLKRRIDDPLRRWKLSGMDLESRLRWDEYSKAKDEMFEYTDIPEAPWYVVASNNKRSARLNCITHMLSLFEYENLIPEPFELPPRPESTYQRPPREHYNYIDEVW